MKRYTKLINRLKAAPLHKNELLAMLSGQSGLFGDPETEFQMLKAYGFPFLEVRNEIHLHTAVMPLAEQTFCIVDIETNGSKPQHAQIIEIGAVKLRNGEIIDRFESFVYCEEVPEYITKITNISASDLVGAPSLKEVLQRFRLFLGDAVFVAHNVNFDYGFISSMMTKVDLGILANRKLCTIDLARRTIESERYGLEHLNAHLGIHTAVSHRAYADALTAMHVMLQAMDKIPEGIETAEHLIEFSSHKTRKSKKTVINETETVREQDSTVV